MSARVLIADRGDAGQRLDLMVRRHLAREAQTSRTRVQHWIESGRVTVNGVAVRRAAARTAAGDIVVVAAPARPRRPAMEAEHDAATRLAVLYEDDELLALDKPAGTVVHPGYGHHQGTTLNALLAYAAAWPSGCRPSIVGRLDKMTSGIVVVAKTAGAHAALQRALAARESAKEYLAVVYGGVRPLRGSIDVALARDPRDRTRMIAAAVNGRASVTLFELLDRGARASLLRCRLVTGRMHQIRAHLAARGWPIVGDRVYAGAHVRPAAPRDVVLHAFPRPALHAWRTAFTHPKTGVRVRIEAPVPEDLSRLLRETGLCAGVESPP